MSGAPYTGRDVGLGRPRSTSYVACLQGGGKTAGRRAGAVGDGRGGRACDQKAKAFPIYEHLFEYIGTQFPPPSSLL